MPTAKSWWQRNERKAPWLVALASFAATAIFLVLFWAPGPVTFSGVVYTAPGDCGFGCPGIPVVSNYLSAGANVTVRWIDVSGGTVSFAIWSPAAFGPVCDENGTSGVCSFYVFTSGNYTFVAGNPGNYSGPGQVVDYQGTYG